ncbi:15492_t:CDS:2, partial [Racocetra persica]
NKTMTENNKQLQYEELSLLISMFNDNEFKWVGDQDQLEHWKSAIDKFMSAHVSGLDVSPFRFRILLDMRENWFNVFLPCRYPEIRPECYFSSDTVTRQTWTEINQEIEKKLNERCDGGFSKPGYPGIIIVEGLYDNVQDYVSRLKSLRWQAITVLSEESEVIYNLPLHDHDKFVKLRLGRIKPGVSEFESMSEMTSKMKEAGLEEMFLSAMKINKKSDKSLT